MKAHLRFKRKGPRFQPPCILQKAYFASMISPEKKVRVVCRIHEQSPVGWLAARKLGSKSVAVTLGRHIYLWGAGAGDFLGDEAWVRHELCHVRQFKKYGWLPFLWLYLLENMRHGYRGNRFETAACQASREKEPLAGYLFETC
jgi:hypothetical protein